MSKSDNSDRPDDMAGFSNYSKKTSKKVVFYSIYKFITIWEYNNTFPNNF